MDDLAPGAYVAHPEFTVAQADGRNRACDDCSVSGWNATSVSEEKLTLCSASDPVDYGSRLLQADPACAPCIGVADEDSAYRNWANGRPEALIMLVFLRGGLRAWRDYALCFGDLAPVYGYNRIRTFLTVFFRVEFALAAWSFFDDTAIVDVRSRAGFAWHLFLKMHALLRIPLKGNPLDPASKDLAGKKFLPPSTNNRFLGEMVSIGRLPCSISPTAQRQESGLFLINEVKRSGRFRQGDAASLFQKLRFLMSAVHGRCGLPALQPIAARQNEDR